MGVRDIFPMLTDGGSDTTSTAKRHTECRECGTNLTPDVDRCPDCGGDTATYLLS